MLNGLDLTRRNPTITRLVEAFNDADTTGGTIDAIKGLWPSILRRTVVAGAQSATAAGADRTAPVPQLIVTATTREAEDLAQALGDWVPASTVAVFPSWETLPHEKLSPRSDTVGQRLEILRRLAHPKPGAELTFIICPVRGLC